MITKTAVITGASSGIGREFTSLFAAHGYDLILIARRIENLQKLADDLHKMYGITANVIQMARQSHQKSFAIEGLKMLL
ncbi:MAG: SDR family NAD(P)-dependent oxidoreductase [Glaciimonas sp.]|nr:SDR family NAD(P)-dependent oxidoreductase [Glaciimonas sp.]